MLVALVMLVSAYHCSSSYAEQSIWSRLVSSYSLQSKKSAISNYNSGDIGACYLAWLKTLQVQNADEEISTERLNEDQVSMYFDDLSLIYNYHTLETEKVILTCMSEETYDQDVALRMVRILSLFAAFEIGNPTYEDFLSPDIMIDRMWPIYEKYQACLKNYEDEILNGKTISFYVSDVGLEYSVSMPWDKGLIIIVE